MNDQDQEQLSNRLAQALAERIAGHLGRSDLGAARAQLEHLLRLDALAGPGPLVDAYNHVLGGWPAGDTAVLDELKARMTAGRQRLSLVAQGKAVRQAIDDPAIRPFGSEQQALPPRLLEALEAHLEPDAAWPFEPLYNADWQVLARADLVGNLALLSRAMLADAQFLAVMAIGVRAGRISALSCYDGASVIELLLDIANEAGPAQSVAYMLGPFGALPFDGTSPRIHGLNTRNLLDISTAERALSYLTFFCGLVHGEAGPFSIVSEAADIAARAAGSALPALPQLQPALLTPADAALSGQATSEQPLQWRADGFVLYSDTLFRATFGIGEKGMVEMIEDATLVEKLPIVQPTFRFGRRARWPAAEAG